MIKRKRTINPNPAINNNRLSNSNFSAGKGRKKSMNKKIITLITRYDLICFLNKAINKSVLFPVIFDSTLR